MIGCLLPICVCVCARALRSMTGKNSFKWNEEKVCEVKERKDERCKSSTSMPVLQENPGFPSILQFLSDGNSMFWGGLCAVNIPIKRQRLCFISEIINHPFHIFTTNQTSPGLKQTCNLQLIPHYPSFCCKSVSFFFIFRFRTRTKVVFNSFKARSCR